MNVTASSCPSPVQVEAGPGGVAGCPLPPGLYVFADQGGPLLTGAAHEYAGHTTQCCPAAALLVQGVNLQSMLAQNDSLKVLLDFNMPCTQVSADMHAELVGRPCRRTFFYRNTAHQCVHGCQVPAQQPQSRSAAACQPSGQSSAQQPTGQDVQPMLAQCPKQLPASTCKRSLSARDWCRIYAPTVCSIDRPLKRDQAGRFWPGEAQPPQSAPLGAGPASTDRGGCTESAAIS